MSLLLVTVSGKDNEKKLYCVYIAVGQKCFTKAQLEVCRATVIYST